MPLSFPVREVIQSKNVSWNKLYLTFEKFEMKCERKKIEKELTMNEKIKGNKK